MQKPDIQKLIDLMFSIAITSAHHMHTESNDAIAKWVADHLAICGYPTTPMGSSWGMLTENQQKSHDELMKEALDLLEYAQKLLRNARAKHEYATREINNQLGL